MTELDRAKQLLEWSLKYAAAAPQVSRHLAAAAHGLLGWKKVADVPAKPRPTLAAHVDRVAAARRSGVDLTEIERGVLLCVEAMPGVTSSEVATLQEISRNYAATTLTGLQRLGLLRHERDHRTQGTSGGVAFRWFLVGGPNEGVK